MGRVFAILSAALVLSLSGLASAQAPSRSVDPTAEMTLRQKSRALDLFLKDAKVQQALQQREAAGYKQLTVEAAPFNFAYGDEGMHTRFLVSAWLGKSEAYGWSSQFVAAIVNTDGWTSRKVSLVDSTALTTALYGLLPKRQ